MERLKIMHVNSRGMWGKKTLFNLALNKHVPDIVSVNEVKTKRELKFEGYQDPVRYSRPPNVDGGGVMLLIKMGLEYEEVTVRCDWRGNEVKAVNVILHDKSKILIASVYCPPGDKNIRLNKNIFKELKRVNK